MKKSPVAIQFIAINLPAEIPLLISIGDCRVTPVTKAGASKQVRGATAIISR